MPGSTSRAIPFLLGTDAATQFASVSAGQAQRVNDLIVALEGRALALENIPRVRSYLTANVQKANGATLWGPLSFTSHSYLSGASLRPAPTRFVAPVTGIYAFDVKVVFDAETVAGRRLVQVRRNSVGVVTGGTQLDVSERQGTTGNTDVRVADQVGMTAGDYLECFVAQDSGATVDIVGGPAASIFSFTYLFPVPL